MVLHVEYENHVAYVSHGLNQSVGQILLQSDNVNIKITLKNLQVKSNIFDTKITESPACISVFGSA